MRKVNRRFAELLNRVLEIWWACLDSNQGHVLPILESLIPGYAIAMRDALDAGDHIDLRRMIELLAALGGQI
mgnify:CR=1 FL=1